MLKHVSMTVFMPHTNSSDPFRHLLSFFVFGGGCVYVCECVEGGGVPCSPSLWCGDL